MKRRQLLPAAKQGLDGGQVAEDIAVSWEHAKISLFLAASTATNGRDNRNVFTK